MIRPERILRAAASLLAADGRCTDPELRFLTTLADRLGIARARVPGLLRDALTGPRPRVAAESTLRLLLEAAAADGEISAAERAMLRDIAAGLRIDPDSLDPRLRAALEWTKAEPTVESVRRLSVALRSARGAEKEDLAHHRWRLISRMGGGALLDRLHELEQEIAGALRDLGRLADEQSRRTRDRGRALSAEFASKGIDERPRGLHGLFGPSASSVRREADRKRLHVDKLRLRRRQAGGLETVARLEAEALALCEEIARML